MEPVSLAVGLVPIFISAIDILDRVRDYKEFGDESETTLSRFEASKLKLQNWAKASGICDGKLSDAHDPRLDEPRTASVVQNILHASIKIFDKVEYQSQSLRLPTRQLSAGIDGWAVPADDIRQSHPERQILSKRSRLAWATGGKARFEKDVRNFESLVNVLTDVVPSRGLEEESLAKMHHLEEKLDLLTDLDVGIEKLLALATAQRQHNVESWLDAVDHEDPYRTLINLRLNGTCEWIIDHPAYTSWMSPDYSNGAAIVLWINGPAGFGKSVLSAALIQHIRATSELPLAFCFSSSHAQNFHEMDRIVRTWTTQLIRQNKASLDWVFQMHQTQKTRRASRDDVWMILKEITTQIHRCVLVLDGLDEFSSDDDRRRRFLGDLKHSLQGTDARILITSRTEFDIESGLRFSTTEPQVYSLLDCNISRHHVKDDIDLVSKSIVARKLPKQEQYLREELAAQMAERCEGQFLWLKFQQDLLRDSKSPKALRSVVQAMPQKLHAIYERSWNYMVALEEPDRGRAIDTLRWLTFAYRPLTVQELAEALVVSLDGNTSAFSEDDLPRNIDVEYIDGELKNLCGSLIEFREDTERPDPASTMVRLVHASVHDFLNGKLPLPSWIGSIPGESCLSAAQHAQLAALCIRFLDCAEAWESGSQTPRSFTNYAADSWFRHVQDTGNNFGPIMTLVNDFIRRRNPNFDKWRVLYEQRCNSSARKPGTSFYYACLFGLAPAMEFLRNSEDCLELNIRGGEYCTPLQAVCSKGDSEAFSKLIQWEADVTIRGGRFGNAFNAAAYHNRIDMVKGLVACGSQAHTLSIEMHGAITTASGQGHVDIVEFLLNQGANINSSQSHSLFMRGMPHPLLLWRLTSPLHAATASIHLSVVKLLLKRGADVNVQEEDGSTALHIAVTESSPEIVEILLDYDADPNIAGPHGGALYLAAQQGHLNIVTQLIDKKAILELRVLSGVTPLHAAARKGHLKVVELLCTRGANLNAQSRSGSTPLYLAARNGHMDTASYLISEGADVNLKNEDGVAALHVAIIHGRSEVASMLIHAGATLHSTDQGLTPLHLAAESGIPELVVSLIQAGADKDAQSQDGINPLHEAAFNRHPTVVDLLLESGAVIKADDQGRTPLHDAADGGSLEVMNRLLEGGADLHAQDGTGRTPLHYAACGESLEVIHRLLEGGADLHARDGMGLTPLHMAAQYNFPNTIAFLLNQGSNIDAQTANGETALSIATSNDSPDVFDLLICREADVNVANSLGFEPLHIAAQTDRIKFVQSLVERGCDVDAKTANDETPLHFATALGAGAIVKYLIQSGADLDIRDSYGMRSSDWLQRSRPNLKTSLSLNELVRDDSSSPNMAILRRTVVRLATRLKEDDLETMTSDCYHLAHCFFLIGMEDEARLAYQQILSVADTAAYTPRCNECGTGPKPFDPFFTYKICPGTDFCERCMRKYHENQVLHNHTGNHEFLRIYAPDAKFKASDTEAFNGWLDIIVGRFKDL